MFKDKKRILKYASRGFICFLAVIILVKLPFSQSIENLPLPENPLKGSRVFFQKGCIKCHQVWGIGQAFGPSLTKIGLEKNFFELTGALWSHSPKMMEVMREKEIERPVLSPDELAELMAYIYYLGFFDELGDYIKGEEIFTRRGCIRCHSFGEGKKKKGPSLDKYGRYISPVFIATALWNHSSTISKAMVDQSFAPREMSHLLAYIKGNAMNKEGEIVHIQPGNPNRGREVFNKKKCTACHGSKGQDLSRGSLRKSLTEIVRMMWNHSYPMWAEMREKGIQIPHFEHEEMADLMTYLYFIPFFGEKSNPERGKEIFVEKGCVSCHSKEAVEKKKGIDLAEVSHFTVFELVSAMWNHVPEMEKMVTELKMLWPRFEKGEMKDLIQYIKSLK